ncbi:MAG: CocE/NonD family hydrolase [Azospirillaceae bacterium]
MTGPLAVAGPERRVQRLSDGCRLVADIWRPEAPGPWPVLLMRQPYGRAIASTVVFAHPAWYAAQGYIVCIQDVRGSGESDGDFALFEAEAADGAEAVDWAADLPGSSGRVGMYGFSYQGVTQLLALAGRLDRDGDPGPVAALSPAMIGWTIADDWAWEGGAFLLAANLAWGAQMAALQARRAGDAEAHAALGAVARGLPAHGPIPALPKAMDRHRRYGHYTDWLENPPGAAYWHRIAPAAALGDRRPAVPMLHVGGWADTMLTGTLAAQAAMTASAAPQPMVIGPWGHIPWGRRVGALDMGPEAASPIDQLQVAFFDRWLKDDDQSAAITDIRLFDIGIKRWRAFDSWPAPSPTTLFPVADGLAAAGSTGRLEDAPPGDGAASDRIVHDPWRPAPALGGHAGAPGGFQNRAAIDDRSDVAVYTGDPLILPMTLAGTVTLGLDIAADAETFDVSAVLSHVTPDGEAWTLTQGYRRVPAGHAGPVTVPMRAVCATLPASARLRLSLAGAAFPAYTVNPGVAIPDAEARQLDQRVVTLALRPGPASRLDLPVVAPEAAGSGA